MADNNYQPGNDLSQFFDRTNPLANKCNSMIFKVDKPYCCSKDLEIAGAFTVNSGAQTVTFTAASPTSGYDVRYFQIIIKDKYGITASKTAVDTDLAAPVVVSVEGLDPNVEWYIGIELSKEKNINTAKSCKSFGVIEVADPTSDPTVTVNTILAVSPNISVFEADGVTPVADGGAPINLGAFPQNSDGTVSVVVKNIAGAGVLEFTGAINGPNIASVEAGKKYVYIEGSLVYTFVVDTSGAPNSYTGAIQLTSNDAANTTYDINVAFDVTP